MTDLPKIVIQPPGPRSRELATDLRRWESPNITCVNDQFPVFWESAAGCLVQDVDGNRLLDLCAAFGAAAVGHCHPEVVTALQDQSARLIHGMGDVHPSELKVKLCQKLASLAPGNLQQVILGCNGSDAVEAALKTACIATGRPGVIAFDGAYHGLGYGALHVTARSHFRKPFDGQMANFAQHVPYPMQSNEICDPVISAKESLDAVELALKDGGVGAVIIEPIQGRAGIRVPPAGFFTDLLGLTHRYGALLIADEIFTGFGRTGEWFASEVAPDLLCVGKAMGGGFPVSACIGTKTVMSAWGESTGEAIHTSTFLGSPLGCASALATIRVIEEENLIERVGHSGANLRSRLDSLQQSCPAICEIRGRGLMLGIQLCHADGSCYPGSGFLVATRALQAGLITLPAGEISDVLELTPAYTISEHQMKFAVDQLETIIQGLE